MPRNNLEGPQMMIPTQGGGFMPRGEVIDDCPSMAAQILLGPWAVFKYVVVDTLGEVREALTIARENKQHERDFPLATEPRRFLIESDFSVLKIGKTTFGRLREQNADASTQPQE
jgi:hypothetical protein